jgi:hypothetical protein
MLLVGGAIGAVGTFLLFVPVVAQDLDFRSYVAVASQDLAREELMAYSMCKRALSSRTGLSLTLIAGAMGVNILGLYVSRPD